MFAEFIRLFFDRIFQVIAVLSAQSSEALTVSEDPNDCATLQGRLIAIVTHIVQQCSEDTLQVAREDFSPERQKTFVQIVREKVLQLITGSLFSAPVRPLALGLIRPLVQCHPVQTLKDLLPRTSQSILDKTADALLMVDDRADLELIWELSLFGELLLAPGEALLIYRTSIRDVLQRSLRIVHRESNQLVARAIRCVLQSLVDVYSIHSPPPPLPVLPIRVRRTLILLERLHFRQLSTEGEDRSC